MSEPEIRFTAGAPSRDEEEAVRAAVLTLWREDAAKAARDAGADPWVLAARIEAARAGLGAVRARGKRNAWRLTGRLGSETASHISIGRGDAR